MPDTPIAPTPPVQTPAPSPADPGAITPAAAAARIKKALIDGKYIRNWRGPDHGKRLGGKGLKQVQRQHIALQAGDITAVAAVLPDRTQIIQDLHLGSSGHDAEVEVVIYADDAFHLVDEYDRIYPPAPPTQPSP